MFWFLIILAILAAAAIAVVLFKHWKEIRLLDPDTIRAEQERQVRERIVRQRFDRRLRHLLTPVARAGHGFVEQLTRTYHQVEQRLAKATAELGGVEAPAADLPSDIRQLLTEAAAWSRDAKWAEAERAYLEILKHDSRQLQAYRGLGALYLGQKQYAQAKETYQFLNRINGCDDACFAGLAEVAEREGNLVDAETMRKRAVEVAPKLAHRHAELSGFYLAHGSPDYAWQSAKRASDLEPDEPRFLELSVEAAILVRDRDEAECRHERLRMLSGDRQKLQALREKIDAMPSKNE